MELDNSFLHCYISVLLVFYKDSAPVDVGLFFCELCEVVDHADRFKRAVLFGNSFYLRLEAP